MTMQSAVAVSRRGFLAGTGSLTFAVLAGGLLEAFPAAAAPRDAASHAVNAWVSIAADGIVTIRYGSGEMGQGVMTSLPLILAEELDADWNKVRPEIVTGDEKTFGNPLTGGILYAAGSSSIDGYYLIMRRAGANARRILIHSAARHWAVPPSEVSTEPGIVFHAASGRRMHYGEVAALPAIVTDAPPVTDAELKPAAAFRLIGRTDIGRVDIPEKTRGQVQYTVDVRVPGMAYATVLRAPVEGEQAASIADAAAKAMEGVLAVVRLDGGVGVVAERWETALAARDALQVVWTQTSPFRSADSAADLERDVAAAADLSRRGVTWSARGDAAGKLAAGRVIEADYATDYVYHAQMEPLAAVASVDGDGKGAEIWVGTQSQTVTRGVAAQVLGTTPDRIRFHALQMGGGFGRRTFFARELLRDALLLSRKAKRPVKLIWTRPDDLASGWFRPATAHKLRAVLNDDGSIAAWHHRIASPSIFGFVAPQRLASTGNKDLLIMEGTEQAEYRIPDLLAEHVTTERRAKISAWRGIGYGHNMYASESFIDELARAAGIDPVTYRRRLLQDNPRGLAVLDAVLTMSDYGKAPAGRAHGLAFAGYRATHAAGVAEVSLDQDSGEIRVHRFWAAVDAGIAIHPRNLEAQVSGGIIYGLSGLLKERITIRNGEVQESNFHDYPVLRMDETPDVEVRLIASDAAPTGAGEVGVPMTGGAVANAVFALTGRRLRHMPFTPDRVKQVLAS